MNQATDRIAIKSFSPPITLMILIFILSSIPGEIESNTLKFLMDLDPTLQNLLHIPLFCLLAYLWFIPLSMLQISKLTVTIIGTLITIFYGCFDEFHQTFVPGRYGSLTDILLDCTGATLSLLIYYLKHQRI